MRKLKILYVDTERVWRGGQEQLFDLMTGMKKRGHEVQLAAPPQGLLAQKSLDLGLSVHPFWQRSEISFLAFFRLRSVLKREAFQIVHFNTPVPIIAGGLACHLSRVPTRISARRVNFPLQSAASRLKYNYLQDKIITVSGSIRQTLLEGGVRPELVEVIYEGVDLEWVDHQQVPRLPVAVHGLIVGTVAHMSPEKGHSVLLESASRVVAQLPDVSFVLVGSGELMPELQRQVQNLGLGQNVFFTGFRSDSEAVMKRFDVLCLPSLSEGLSSAILLAMANRLPVVATRAGGIPELVKDGETGILVPPSDSVELARALLHLLGSAPLRRQMGEAGRRQVEERFTLTRKLDETERLYLELAGRGGSDKIEVHNASSAEPRP